MENLLAIEVYVKSADFAWAKFRQLEWKYDELERKYNEAISRNEEMVLNYHAAKKDWVNMTEQERLDAKERDENEL